LERNLAGSHNKWIWKTKVPLKIKVFLWQLCSFVKMLFSPERIRKKKEIGLVLLDVPSAIFLNLKITLSLPVRLLE
jgi:hypothetical protein